MRGTTRTIAALTAAALATTGVVAMNPAAGPGGTPEALADQPATIFDPLPPPGTPGSPTITLREVIDTTRSNGLPDVAVVSPAAANVNPAASPIPALSSRPGADITIYLDFDGFFLDGTTGWNKYMGLPAMDVPPFDLDGNPGSFSDREQDAIASTWAYVSEDYAPWNVNVTTIDPGLDALVDNGNGDRKVGIRVLFAQRDGQLHQLACNAACTGKAYTGVFASTWMGQRIGVADTPALVFTTDTYTTASHEVGHALGLLHHGTESSEYFFGQGKWSPIMGGTNMARTVTQWSKGEYDGANRSDQDDLQRIRNILPLVNDVHSSNPAAATPIQPGEEVQGMIGLDGDVDMFKITVDKPTWINAAPRWPRGANNVDLKMTIINPDTGQVVETVDPLNTNGDIAGMSASTTLQPGTWVISLEGTGFGSPLTDGYSTYGSVGTYTLKSTGQAPKELKILGPGLWAVKESQRVNDFPFTIQGGVAPYEWTAPWGLPGDLRLSRDGTVDGRAPGAIGRWSIVVAVTDATGQVSEFNTTISTADNRSGPIRESLTMMVPEEMTFATGQRVNVPFKPTGGSGEYIFNDYGLPPGLELQEKNGNYSLVGTPTRTGSWRVDLTVYDTDNNAIDVYFTVTVEQGDSTELNVTVKGKKSVKVKRNVRLTVVVAGGENPKVTSPTVGRNIPRTRGLKLTRYTRGDTDNQITYRITGKARKKGTYRFVITVQDGNDTKKVPVRIRVR